MSNEKKKTQKQFPNNHIPPGGIRFITLPTPINYQLGTDLPVDSSTIRGGMADRDTVKTKLRAWAAGVSMNGSTVNPIQSVIDRAVTA